MKKRLISTLLACSLVAGSVLGMGQATKVEASGVAIKSESFGGDAQILRTAEGADSNKDGILSDQEATTITTLYFEKQTNDVSQVVKYFPKATRIYVNVGDSASLKIGSSVVKSVSVTAQKVINLTESSSVTEVNYTLKNKTGNADFSQAKGYDAVKKFYISGSGLTGVVAPNQSKLTDLEISGTKLSKFDGAKYKKVENLALTGNKLTSVNVKKNTALVSLGCYNNKIKSLSLASNKKLTKLNLSFNKLTKIDVSKNTKLERADLSGNALKKLDVSKNKRLTSLYASENKLTKFKLTKSSKIERLRLSGNKLTAFVGAKNKNLSALELRDNKLTKLDVTKYSNLYYIDASENKLTKLDVTKNKKLTGLYVSDNKLAKLNVTKNPKLSTLYINKNKIKSITLSKNKELYTLSVYGTQLKKLSLGKNKNLRSISVGKKLDLLKYVKANSNGYMFIEAKLTKNKTYELTKLIPALKGYKFSCYGDLVKVSESGKLKMPSVKKNQYVSVSAVKGDSSVSINLNGSY